MVTNPTIQQQCKEFIDKVREARFNKVRDRQIGKFIRLLNRNNLNGSSEIIPINCQVDSNNNTSDRCSKNQMQGNTDNSINQVQGSIGSNVNQVSKWVVNLSSSPLTPALQSLLSKGPYFSLAPSNSPSVEFISVVESACQRLLEQVAQELRWKSTSY